MIIWFLTICKSPGCTLKAIANVSLEPKVDGMRQVGQGKSTLISGKTTACHVVINNELTASPLSLTNVIKEQKAMH